MYIIKHVTGYSYEESMVIVSICDCEHTAKIVKKRLENKHVRIAEGHDNHEINLFIIEKIKVSKITTASDL